MIDPLTRTKILDINALWWGITTQDLMENAGKAIAEELLEEFGVRKSYTFICGLGNNGGDAMRAASYLSSEGVENITLYLIGRESELKTQESKTAFYLLKEIQRKKKNIIIVQDAFAKDIEKSDVIIEGLLGAGFKGRLHKRFADVTSKISKLQGKKVSIDVPVPGYKADLVLNLQFEKTKGAKVIDIGIPAKVSQYVGPGEVTALYEPEPNAYKTQTGELFVFGGSDTFHGAPLMAIQAASKFIGSVYFYTTPGNRELLSTLKSKICEFITVNDSEIEKYAGYADVILMGPGLQENLINRSTIEMLFKLFPEKKKVLDAYAIAMAPKDDLTNCILTPHRGELRHIWGDKTAYKTQRLESNLRRFAVERNCHVVLKGHVDMIFSPDGEVKLNLTGNAGLAKGGTGDILSGIVGAFATKNELDLAAQAAIFATDLAGDMAFQDYRYNFSATDTIPYLQKVVKLCNDVRFDSKAIEVLRKIVDPNKRV